MNNFLENFYGTLFSPNETLDRLKENPPLVQGLVIVILISILNPILNFSLFDGIKTVALLGLNVIGAAFAGVISWLFFGAFLEIVASIFKQSGRIKETLTLTGFALLPWIFLAPVELFKTGGIFWHIIGSMLGIAIWIWAVVLILLSIMKVYNLSPGRVMILALVPFLGGVLAFNWIIGFFSTLFSILKT